MAKAILTKCIPATNTKGTRIQAYDCDNNKVTMSYPYGLDEAEAHRTAAVMLCNSMGWSTEMVQGGTKEGYAFVRV